MERETLLSIYSDVHKEAAGFRPRDPAVNSWTDEQIVEEIEELSRFAWQTTLEEACYQNRQPVPDMRRMNAAEIIHRVDTMRPAGRKTRGKGWALVTSTEERLHV